MPQRLGTLDRLRAICTEFPEVTERPSHGAPTWFVRDKRSFVTLWEHGHHDNEFAHLWCAAPPGAQEELLLAAPERVFRPPYVGHRGWLGVRLDGSVDWTEIAELCVDAYRAVAPKSLADQLVAGVVVTESQARLSANHDLVDQIERTVADPSTRVRRGRPQRTD